MDPGSMEVPIWRHSWYEWAPHCNVTHPSVIKTHRTPVEITDPEIIHRIHLIRDGRDVAVSMFFFHTDFLRKNGIVHRDFRDLNDCIQSVAQEWKDYCAAWMDEECYSVRYESLKDDAAREVGTLVELCLPGGSTEYVGDIARSYSMDRMRKSFDQMFQHNTVVRRGVSGGWREYFGPSETDIFKSIAGDMLVTLGYERNLDW
jgi:hypothetical protein